MKNITLLSLLLLATLGSVRAADLDEAYTCMRLADFECAARLFARSARSGNAEAQFQLGKLYMAGRGVTQNTATAQKWLRLAADNDVAGAQFALGVSLAQTGNHKDAMALIRRAAEQDYRPALARLKKLQAAPSPGLQSQSRDTIQDQWFKAVIGCNHDRIMEGIRSDVDINQTDKYNRTPLHYLVNCGDREATAALLKRGATPDTPDKFQQSPLELAVRKNDPEMATLLIGAGANKGSSGESLLHIAVTQKSTALVKELLQANFSHSEMNDKGRTPLDLASDHQLKNIENMLVQAGATHSPGWARVQQPSGEQTLGYLEQEVASTQDLWHSAVQAINQGQTKVLAALLKNNPKDLLDREDEKHLTLLLYATEIPDEESIATLARAGADINRANLDGTTSLMVAAKRGKQKTVGQLLALGANREIQDKQGRDAIHHALLNQQDDTAIQLLEGRVLPQNRTLAGESYLMLALQGESRKSVDWILEHDIHINVRDEKRRTALWYAASSCDTSSVQRLLDMGASVQTSDSRGYSSLHTAVADGCLPVVEKLLAFDANINDPTLAGNTALILAAQNGNTDITLALLAHNADIKAQNNKGDTALLAAVRSGDTPELIAALLDAGSDPYRRNSLGESALSIAETSAPQALAIIEQKSSFSLFSLGK